MSHAQIGGVQPHHGWWAPIVQRYINRGVGAGARTPRFVVAALPTYNPKPPIRLVRCSGGKLRHRRHHSVAVMGSTSQVKPDGIVPLLLPLHFSRSILAVESYPPFPVHRVYPLDQLLMFSVSTINGIRAGLGS
jgi:hypothetical protein